MTPWTILLGAKKSGSRSAALENFGGGAGRGGNTGGDVLDNLTSGAALTSTNLLGSRPRPSPLKIEKEDHALLAPVAEEPCDIGEQSLESSSGLGIQNQQAHIIKSRAPTGEPESPADGSDGALGMSIQSNFEMNADYSVEDSMELEKCDHVEVVELKAAYTMCKQTASGSLAASNSPKTSQPSNKEPAKATTDSPDSLVKAKPPSAGDSFDDDEYKDEKFDDENMSVPESIEDESIDASTGEETV